MKTLAYQLVECLSKEVQPFQDRLSSYDSPTVLFDAAKFGNAEFLNIFISSYPDIIWIADNQNRSLFHIAVLNRQESVFNLIYEIAAVKEIILTYVDDKNENILHLARYLAPSSRLNIVSGAALQMQRELLWFKEEEKIVPSSYLNMKSSGLTPGDLFPMKHKNLRREGEKRMKDTANNCMIVATLITTVVFAAAFTVPGGSSQDTGTPILLKSSGLTPGDLFTMKHKNLRREGEKRMKDTANNCMIVATLITTLVFAAAFTVPGGSSQDTGTPILLKSIWFRVFFISDAIALFSSSSSILIFLSILTSRFTEMDFLLSLPSKLVLGLTTLFISIAGMVVAFSATCFLVFKSEMTSLPIVIIALAGVPIILFVLLHYQLWVDIIRSTFLSRFLFSPP
ncbi:ankyrin repeat-containing protein NPR4-like [Quercus robur]|uniref:ankyrin repeat-containing protein NPR4-like n=1 Tax=Quercus robur TaxID=38942 RepID=UPI0021627B7F|nr:ankyrin repeat-containing protein NPR4-like [Quercus robur]